MDTNHIVRTCGTVAVALSMFCFSAFAGSNRPLIDAVKNQDANAVRELIEQNVDVNLPQGDGATALHWAVYRDDLEIAKALISSGA